MSEWSTQLLQIRSTSADVQRRGRNLIILSLGMTMLGLAFLPVILAMGQPLATAALLVVAALVFLGTAILGRAGYVSVGAYLLISLTVVATLGSTFIDASQANVPFFLVLAVLMAGVLLPAAQIWAVLLFCLAGIAVLLVTLPAELQANRLWIQSSSGAALLLVMVALITFVSARGIGLALAATEQARKQAERAGTALLDANAALEARVAERTTELRLLVEEQRTTTADLAASLEAQRQLNQVIANLSVPIIPISASTLIVPLVGTIDSARAEQLLSAVLTQVEVSRARSVILDVTGVAIVDTQVAAALLRVAAAARLMGAEAMLVGVRPEVAQVLVHLGVDLNTLHTAATLQAALQLETGNRPAAAVTLV